MYHRTSYTHYGHVIALYHSILLRVIRNRELLLNTLNNTILHELIGGVLTPIIRSKYLDSPTKLILH